MRYSSMADILSLCAQKQELEDTISYLTVFFSSIVKCSEVTLICFSRNKESDLGSIIGEAVRRCGSKPVFWEGDLRWKELLKLAFQTKASTIVGPPLVILGLAKLSLYTKIPTNFYNVVLAGYPCLDWMIEGIERIMDCKTWGILTHGLGPIVAGASCKYGTGIHIRENKYSVCIAEREGQHVEAGLKGTVILAHKEFPDLRFKTNAIASISGEICPCGNPASKLVDIDVSSEVPEVVCRLTEELLSWSSILECCVSKNDNGLELEIVCFKGEKLPKLPSCAKLLLRNWDPEKDVPISLDAAWLNG